MLIFARAIAVPAGWTDDTRPCVLHTPSCLLSAAWIIAVPRFALLSFVRQVNNRQVRWKFFLSLPVMFEAALSYKKLNLDL